MKSLITLLAGLAVAMPLYAQPVPQSEGTVRKLDVPNAKITLRHGPIVNLDMPPMSMVFRVQPPELMNGLKVGDTVKFHAESIDGNYTVTAIQKAP
ncbi:MAG: copper-binding protein [Pseudomonadota bacterium]|jgi:Cu/Ag efflux protein CusF